MNLDLIDIEFGRGRENALAAVNPIQRECVDRIEIRAGRPNVLCPTGFAATVWFYAGKTKAWHEIQGTSLADLVQSVNLFIESLPA